MDILLTHAYFLDIPGQPRGLLHPSAWMDANASSVDAKTWVLIWVCIMTNVAGNCMLGAGMQQMGATIFLSPLGYVPALLNPWVLSGTTILILWMLTRLALHA